MLEIQIEITFKSAAPNMDRKNQIASKSNLSAWQSMRRASRGGALLDPMKGKEEFATEALRSMRPLTESLSVLSVSLW